jgi:hypothetical protein
LDVPTLILLGAAGGLLRGALDLYTRFVSWQADRNAHRQAITAGTAQGEAPRFQAYFDPPVDIAAAVVHTVMGAGAAVLFGTTGRSAVSTPPSSSECLRPCCSPNSAASRQ